MPEATLIYNLLASVRPDVDFSKSRNFVEDGLLDSLDILSTIANIESRFSIAIGDMDLVPENFATVEAIQSLISRNSNTQRSKN